MLLVWLLSSGLMVVTLRARVVCVCVYVCAYSHSTSTALTGWPITRRQSQRMKIKAHRRWPKFKVFVFVRVCCWCLVFRCTIFLRLRLPIPPRLYPTFLFHLLLLLLLLLLCCCCCCSWFTATVVAAVVAVLLGAAQVPGR